MRRGCTQRGARGASILQCSSRMHDDELDIPNTERRKGAWACSSQSSLQASHTAPGGLVASVESTLTVL